MARTRPFRKNIEDAALVLAALLFMGFGLSFLARHHWVFDLFSHFMIQYALGGTVLAVPFFYFRRWVIAFACTLIACVSFYNVRGGMAMPWNFGAVSAHYDTEAGADFTIMHYNKLYRNDRYDLLDAWLEMHGNGIDVLFVQESGVTTMRELERYKDIFPYHYPEKHGQRFNDVSVLSKKPINISPVRLDVNGSRGRKISRIDLKIRDDAPPVSLYSYHTLTPTSRAYQDTRNQELLSSAMAIAEDPGPYKIFTGDFNITPYSPYFRDLLDISGLHYQSPGILPVTTWPSFTFLPFLKIPIDHVLYSDGLELVSLEAGPSMGSDHHPLLASFRITPHDSLHVESTESSDH